MVIMEIESKDDRKTKIRKHLLETLATMKYVLFVAKCAGMLYLSFDRSGYKLETGNRKFRILYTLTYLAGYFVVSLIGFLQSDLTTPNGTLYFAIKYIFNVCCIANVHCQLFMGYFLKSSITGWFNKLATWDATLEAFGLRVNSKPLQSLFAGLVFVEIWSISIKMTLYVAAFHRPWTICVGVAMFYLLKSTSKYLLVFTIFHIRLRFQNINEAIGAINLEGAWDVLSIVRFTKSIRKDSPCRLNQLCRFHFKLGQLSREMNEMVSLYFIYTFAVCSASLLFFSYFLYHNIRTMTLQKSEFTTADVIVISYGAASMLGEISDCFAITKSCTLLCNTANETPRYLHELRNRIMNREWDEHIAANSLQFLHQRLLFTANGYFDISFGVMGSISATVLTYLVLFIQQDQEVVTR